jgi:6-phosphogluconate dehydrogenase
MQEKLSDLLTLKGYIETKIFQDNVIKPLFAELDKQKNAYDCKTLQELATVKGKKEGLLFLIELFKTIDNDIKNLKYELDTTDIK